MRITPLISSALYGAALLVAASTGAQTYSFDFEGLATGNIHGQGNWIVDPQGTRSASVVDTGGLSYTSGDVNISGGSKALVVNLSTAAADTGADFLQNSFAPHGGGADNTVYFSVLFSSNTSSWSFVNMGFFGETGHADIESTRGGAAVVLRSPEQFRVWNDSEGNSQTGVGNIPADQVHMLIGRIAFNASGNDVISLALNPNSLDEALAFTTEGAEVAHIFTGMDIDTTSISYFGVRPNTNALNGILTVDNIRVADNFGAVIPEPGTYAMFAGIAVLGIAVYHRRRK